MAAEGSGAVATRRAVVALGANLGDRAATLDGALALIAAEIGTIEARSRWHETEALIHPDDPATTYPAFLNGCAVVATALEAPAVLEALHGIEHRLGRDRGKETAPWRPRVIDLDLLAVDDEVRGQEPPILPHPRLHERRFVLAPLVEIWPDWRHPILKLSAGELLAQLPA